MRLQSSHARFGSRDESIAREAIDRSAWKCTGSSPKGNRTMRCRYKNRHNEVTRDSSFLYHSCDVREGVLWHTDYVLTINALTTAIAQK